MSSKESVCLFIGGAQDGRRLAVPFNRSVWAVPIDQEAVLKVPTGAEPILQQNLELQEYAEVWMTTKDREEERLFVFPPDVAPHHGAIIKRLSKMYRASGGEDQKLADACREWMKGCTATLSYNPSIENDPPWECEPCTMDFLRAIDRIIGGIRE